MNKMQEQVEVFHATYGVPRPARPQMLSAERLELRLRLMREELQEFNDSHGVLAFNTNRQCQCGACLAAAADALCDLLYVTLGTASEMGIDIEPLFNEVQRSNMSKLGNDGKPIYDGGGKVLKGPNFRPPQLEALIDEQIRQRRFPL